MRICIQMWRVFILITENEKMRYFCCQLGNIVHELVTHLVQYQPNICFIENETGTTYDSKSKKV